MEELEEAARTHTLFLYVDPFSISSVRLSELSRVFQRVATGSSVEVLMIFFADHLVRWAEACIANEQTINPKALEEIIGPSFDPVARKQMFEFWSGFLEQDEKRAIKYVMKSREDLTAIAGGDYWESIIRSGVAFADKVERVVEAYSKKLEQWFEIVVPFPLRAAETDQIPKYWMMFASRYPGSVRLINEAMATITRKQYEEWGNQTIFSSVNVPVKPTAADVETAIMAIARNRTAMQWERLKSLTMRQNIGRFRESEVDNAMKSLLTRGNLAGPSGRVVENKAIVRLPV